MKLDIWNKMVQSLMLTGERGSVKLAAALIGESQSLYNWHCVSSHVARNCELPYIMDIYNASSVSECAICSLGGSSTDCETGLIELYQNRKK